MNYYAGEFDLPPPSGNPRSYVICSTGRSGSTLLADVLHHTHKAGVPLEYLHPTRVQTLDARWNFLPADNISFAALLENRKMQLGVDWDGYIKLLRRHRSTENGVFGIKVHYPQLFRFEQLGGNLLASMPGAKFICIRRNDRLLQAISQVIAVQTGRWSSTIKTQEKGEPAYNAAHIAKAMEWFAWQDNAWKQWFETRNIKPLVVIYEDLITDLSKIAEACLQFVSDEKLPAPAKASVAKQGGQLNLEWKERYLSEGGSVTGA